MWWARAVINIACDHSIGVHLETITVCLQYQISCWVAGLLYSELLVRKIDHQSSFSPASISKIALMCTMCKNGVDGFWSFWLTTQSELMPKGHEPLSIVLAFVIRKEIMVYDPKIWPTAEVTLERTCHWKEVVGSWGCTGQNQGDTVFTTSFELHMPAVTTRTLALWTVDTYFSS